MANIKIKKSGCILFIAALFIASCVTDAYEEKIKNDSHYTRAGFFDLHVCNWPGRPLFFLAVFSTFDYKNIESVDVFRPDGSKLDSFNLRNSKVKNVKGKKTKHIIIDEFAVSSGDKNGWYHAEINLAGGKKIIARDYVNIQKMPVVEMITPRNSTEIIKIPEMLSWRVITEAGYYKVTIRDIWENGRVIHSSPLLRKNSYELPKGLIKPGGWYTWRVHARDINEDVLLGDFNHGSLTNLSTFLTVD